VQDRHERRRILLRGAVVGSRELLRVMSIHAIGAAQLVAWGVTFYAIPPLLPRIGATLDVSMSTLSVALTVALGLNAIASLAVARWIHHRGARTPMVVGTIVATTSLVVLATSPTGVVAVAAIAMLGAAQAALLYEPAFAAVATRTNDPIARTRAIQVITFWGGWAALWALPVASLLADAIGWRWTLLALAVLLLYPLRVHASLPEPTVSRKPRAGTAPPISIGLAAAFAIGAFASTAMAVNGLLLLGARGLSISTASVVFAALAPFQVFGRAWFMRRGAQLARHDGSTPFVLIAAGLVALLAAPRWSALAIFIVLFGAGAGLLTTIRPAVVVARLAPEHAALQLGTYSFVTSLARAVAPALSSAMYFAVGYELSLVVLAAMAVAAAALVWRATGCACPNQPRAICNSWLQNGGASC
jgi:predicted MFS family arabinose efflux permease